MVTEAVHPIVGTWQLQTFTELDIESKTVSHPMGRNAKATVIYTASGHVATIFAAEGRNRGEATPASDADAAHLFRTMVAFAGRYEVDGGELTYYPEITWNEAWSGTRQVRHFEIVDGLLHIRSVPAKSAWRDTMTSMAMTWTRVA
jgi:hypothetical protein